MLQVLLTSGADISLIDYRLFLTPEECAYKEQQWRAFTMLTTYGAILTIEHRLSKFLPEDDLEPDQDQDDSISDTFIHETVPECRATNPSTLVYGGEEGRIEKRDHDKRTKTLEDSLDKNALVKKHRRNMETYQCPDDLEDESICSFDNNTSFISGSNLKESKVQTTKRILEEKLPWLRSEKPQSSEQKSRRHSWMKRDTNRTPTSGVDGSRSKHNSVHLPRSGNSTESVKNARVEHLSVVEEKEMLMYGYAESEASQRKCRSRQGTSASSSVGQQSQQSNELNDTMLCKMSRIFLYVLKKRKSKYHQLEE